MCLHVLMIISEVCASMPPLSVKPDAEKTIKISRYDIRSHSAHHSNRTTSIRPHKTEQRRKCKNHWTLDFYITVAASMFCYVTVLCNRQLTNLFPQTWQLTKIITQTWQLMMILIQTWQLIIIRIQTWQLTMILIQTWHLTKIFNQT